MSYEEAELLDGVSFDSWIRNLTARQNVYDFFRGIIWTLTTIPYPEEVSAGEVIITMKMSLDSLHRLSSGTFGVGGSINLIQPLVEYIVSRGGEVRTGARVAKILVQGGEVKGLSVEKPLYGLGYQYPETETIASPIVVHSSPIWDLFDLISPEEFPSWFGNLVKSYKSPLPFSACTIGINFFMSERVLKDTHHRVAFALPHSKLSHQCSVVSASDPTVAPVGREWISVGGGYLNERDRTDRSKVNAAFEALEEDLQVMYPQIYRGNILAKARRFVPVIDGLKRSPFYTGRFRIPHKAPGVRGLFFAGDTVQTRGCGVDAAARSGVLCAGAVLGEQISTFRVNR
jgi:phytoene dehydrogenase-like protein